MKPSIWRLFSLLMIGSMVLSLAGVTAIPQPAAAAPLTEEIILPERSTDKTKTLQLEPATAVELVSSAAKGQVMYEVAGATGPATYIVQLEAVPLASYRGGVAGLTATSPVATGAAKLDVNSAASRAYRTYLAKERASFLQQVERNVGRDVKVLYTYDVAYNGVAVELTPEEAAQVAQMPGVRRVIRNFERYIQTDTSPEYLNAVGIWDGSNTGILSGTMGAGIVVGIIDTGINMDHPSFADVGDDGYDHTNPLGAGNYTGWCNPAHASYDPTLVCNDKLIGVYSYPDSGNDPEDDHSHGSHTASTTAGNVILTPTTSSGVEFAQMSGMAPHANIIAYDVCIGTGGCQLTSILAAIDDAVADAVDIINYSIGGGPTDPWNDPDSAAYLAARDAGVFVATSAGNDGPDPGTAGSPGNAPWVTTVANGTHNRSFAPNGVANMQGGTPPTDIPGTGISGEYTARIVYAADYGNALCGSGPQATPTNPFAPDTWNGEIVVCDRGTYYLVDKAAHVLKAGAGGVIIANTSATGAQTYYTDFGMPGTHVTYDNGELLRVWLVDSDTNVYTATITASPVIHDDDLGDILAAGSSRGPNVNPNFIKPDIMAPGTNIFAAYAGDADSFGMMSGTSMASPHVAGAAALMRALYPDWTEAEIQSALMMTSKSGVVKQDASTPADPFDVGAGRLDLTNAALAGLVLDETTANFEAADPALGGDPTTLNLASLASGACLQECSWERTFRNTTGEVVTWTVSFTGDIALAADPALFSVAAGATQVVEFTADVSDEIDGVWLFGTVILTANDPNLPVQHLPVAVLPTSGVLPELVTINTHRNAGTYTIEDVQAIEILTMTIESFGLAQAILHDFSLYQDPTNSAPYDDLSQVFSTLVTVPAGAKRMVAEVTASESPDVDLFVLYNTGAGYAEVCVSATSAWAEYCNLTDPAAGNYLVIVQNWQGSANQPDAITLAVGVVPGADAGNMEIEGPASVAEMEFFDLELSWDTPEMVAGDRWYAAFSLGSEPDKAGNIATVPVNIIRWEDDVVKDATAVKVGEDITITYQLTVQPNVSPENYTLTLTDTIPAGLTYVAGSAMATEGAVNVTGDTLTWAGVMSIPAPGEYLMTTSEDDPACAMPLANSGAYLNLQAFGIAPQAAISGDTIWFTAFGTGSPFIYWDNQYTGIGFTDDGMAFFGSTPGTTPWINEDIPNAADPNNLLAFFWNDWEVIYSTAPISRGVSLASLGGTGPGGGVVIEYDDVQAYGEPGETLDFQVFVWRTPDETLGDPDIVFAYDNISLTTPIEIGTIGIENALGTAGVKYAYDDAALQTLQNGMAICFDWYVVPTDPVYITYQVTVDDPTAVAEYTNVVDHDTDAPGTVVETTSHTITIDDQPPTIVKTVSPEYISNHGDIVTYTIKLTNPNIYPIDSVTMTDTLPLQLTFEAWVKQSGATLVLPGTIEWTGTIPAEGTVEFVFTASTPEDTHYVLIDIVNTAYMGYPGGTDSSSVSFSLIRKIYLPLVMRAYTP